MSKVALDEHIGIPYIPAEGDLYHQFDLYLPKHDPHSHNIPPLICFIHGGAWRSEDKSQHAALARQLAEHTSLPVAVPNYRLTKPETPYKHPAHTEDLLDFLHFILTWDGPPGGRRPYDPSKIYLLGHSCSAHMLTSIFLTPPAPYEPFETLAPSPDLLAATRGVVLSEGIYDIDLLLRSFPTYKDWFIAATFGDLSSYARFNTAHYTRREGGQDTRWLIIHSTGDTLVDMIQSENMYTSLQSMFAGAGSGGAPAQNVQFDRIVAQDRDHNDVLNPDFYTQVVSPFILADTRTS